MACDESLRQSQAVSNCDEEECPKDFVCEECLRKNQLLHDSYYRPSSVKIKPVLASHPRNSSGTSICNQNSVRQNSEKTSPRSKSTIAAPVHGLLSRFMRSKSCSQEEFSDHHVTVQVDPDLRPGPSRAVSMSGFEPATDDAQVPSKCSSPRADI